MADAHLAVHGHFYQPPRENPWTEAVPVEESAAPFHDWNARITAECYRANAYARIVDDQGRVVAIVDNYDHLSFNVGPTLASWLADHEPEVLARMVEGDRRGGGAIAQAYSHPILPLADDRDVRTQVRWGMADFEARFGRPAEGMWLPETAVNDDVLAILVDEGVGFTILAPGQAARHRPLGSDDDAWTDVNDGSIDTRRSYRWLHPAGDGRGVDIVFYDGPLSHDVAFGGATSSQALVARARTSGNGGGLVCVATDGETFGHHQRWADRALAYALTVEARRAGVPVVTVREMLRRSPPARQVEVRESSWSCVHGVERWRADCGCSTGGEPGWNQRWREPLRQALDVLRDAAREVFERRGAAVLRDPWAARDAYVDVLLGRTTVDELAERHVVGDRVEALTLLESQRHAMLMYTSCGWFFNDLAGLETVQVLRYAARSADLLRELGEDLPMDAFLETLAKAESNRPEEGNGRDIWERRVQTARVDADRVVAHLALLDLLEHEAPATVLGGFAVTVTDCTRDERGSVTLSSGRVALVHRRTGRRTEHVWAAVHLGGLEVLGATRAADPVRDEAALPGIRDAFASGTRVTTMLRLVSEGFGPREFGLEATLADAPDQILATTARALADRFVESYERLLDDHRTAFRALGTAGYPLPAELRAPAELALVRRLEGEIAAQQDAWDPSAYRAALDIARDARHGGFRVDGPAVAMAMARVVLAATVRAVERPGPEPVDEVLSLVRLAREIGVALDVDRAQEAVYEALLAGGSAELRPLAAAFGLVLDDLGHPG